MKRSPKSFNRLSLILAALLLTTASLALANRSGHPTSKSQAAGRHTAPTTTSQPDGFVEDNLASHNSPDGLSAATPTPSPSRIYRVVPVYSDKRFEHNW